MEIGRELNGRYIVKGLLGEGGEGRTYLVYDKQQNQKMAVKELEEKPSDVQLAAWERLIRLGKLPGLAQLFAMFEEEQIFYMVMEYIEGVNGVQLLANSGQGIAAAQAASIMCPVVRGVSILHENGLLHRDISTDNVIITADGYGVLCDFSLLCENRQDGVVDGASRVKNGFSPIELYTDGGRQGQWSDVYEICATLYQLLTGQVLTASTERGEEDPFAGFAIQLPEESLCVIRAGLELEGEQRLDNLLPVCQILERASAMEAQYVSANSGQPYIAQNGMRTLPLNAQSVISFQPDNAMNAKKKNERGTGRKMTMAFVMVCVLFVFFAAGVWFYNAKVEDSNGDGDSARQEKKNGDADTTKPADGADISLDQLMELYADYLKYEFADNGSIDGYKLICFDSDDLPECYLSSRWGDFLLFYNSRTKKCEGTKLDISINNSFRDTYIKYTEYENMFCIYDVQFSNVSNQFYHFGEDGKPCLIGSSYIVGEDTYAVGNRYNISLREYEEYNNDFGEYEDCFGYQDMYVSLEKAYEKFLAE